MAMIRFQDVQNRLSLCHGTMITIPAPDFVHAAADAGFRRVSLRVRNPSSGMPGKVMGELTLEGDTPFRRETRRALDERGMVLLEAEAAVVTPQTDLAELHPYMESAAALGAVGVIPVFSGHTSEAQVADQLAAFAAQAKGYGLKALIEFIAVFAVSSIAMAERVIRASGADNCGIIIDSLHWTRSGGTAEDIRGVDPALIASSQISDGLRDFPNDGQNWWHEMSHARRFLGEGDFAVKEMIAALPAHVPIGIEVISAEFQQRGLGPRQMAQFAMDNARAFFA